MRLLITSQLRVLHTFIGLIIYFELAKTRTLIKLPTRCKYVQTTPSIWNSPIPGSPQVLVYQESTDSPFKTQLEQG